MEFVRKNEHREGALLQGMQSEALRAPAVVAVQ